MTHSLAPIALTAVLITLTTAVHALINHRTEPISGSSTSFLENCDATRCCPRPLVVRMRIKGREYGSDVRIRVKAQYQSAEGPTKPSFLRPEVRRAEAHRTPVLRVGVESSVLWVKAEVVETNEEAVREVEYGRA